MIRRPLLLLLLIFSALATPAHADGVKDELKQKYKNQLLTLRSPSTGRTQKFDASGQPVTPPSPGQWLCYGGIYVDKVDLSDARLRLEGLQVVPTGQKKKGKPVFMPIGGPVTVEIDLSQPLASADQAQTVMDHVFFLGAEAVQHARPECRRSDDSISTIYSAGKEGVKYPESVFAPEPSFSEEARRANYQGTTVMSVVVDKEGNISRIRLERPLGMGLDEKAIERLKTWRFKPGTYKGQPVAVAMSVEVAFNLY